MTDIILPTKKVRATDMSPGVLVIYGPPKIGKTSILSELPDCLTIDIEKGARFLDTMKYECNSFNEVKEVGREIIKQGRPYKYVALDTVTELEAWAEYQATLNYMNSNVGKNFNRNELGDQISRGSDSWQSCLTLEWGAGHQWFRQCYKEWLKIIYKLADRIILVGHVRDKVLTTKNKEVDSKDIDLTGKIKAITCSKADAIGYIYREEDELWVTFQTDDVITAGTRPKHLINQKFKFDWKKIYVD